jgi:alkylation response protein AidB-like acyl-CoA dehydrogenase
VDDTMREIRSAVGSYLDGKVRDIVAATEHAGGAPTRSIADLDAMGFLDLGLDHADGGTGLAGEVALVGDLARVWGSLAVAVAGELLVRRAQRATSANLAGAGLADANLAGAGLAGAAPIGGVVADWRPLPAEPGRPARYRLSGISGSVLDPGSTVPFLLLGDVLDPAANVGVAQLPIGGDGVNTCELTGLRGLVALQGEVAADAATIGDHRTLEHLVAGRLLLLSAAAGGLALGALEGAVRYAKDRHQFGHPIGYYGEIQALLARGFSWANAMTDTVVAAAARFDQGGGGGAGVADAARVFLFCSDSAAEVCDRAQHVYGGYGQMAEFGVGRFVRDARTVSSAAGHHADLVQVIARDLALPS